METEAKLSIQERIRQGEIDLCWSFVLDYENAANPFEEVSNRVAEWKFHASKDCDLSDEIADKATARCLCHYPWRGALSYN
jgi:hypothetical protein